MAISRLCGYDINGWHDKVARNWQILSGEIQEVKGDSLISDAGYLPTVIEAFDTWIGGTQARLAPHGRGAGWGKVGETSNRIPVHECIWNVERETELLTSAINGLASGANHAILSIDDIPCTTEQHQERLLNALTAAKISNKLLVWRPVLATLYELERAGSKLTEGMKVGVVCHAPHGFSIQKLELKRESGDKEKTLAPERQKQGVLVKSGFGYESLVKHARSTVKENLENSRRINLEYAQSIGRLAFGGELPEEIVRTQSGGWEVIRPPNNLNLCSFDLDSSEFQSLQDCDVVLIESLCERGIRTFLFDELKNCIGNLNIEELPATAVAEGALIASKRLKDRKPIYFDFLPQISTIVLEGNKGANYDLIETDETLVAGKIYKSPQPARFGLHKDQSNVDIYLKKETFERPRKAVVELKKPLKESTTVELTVEQAPAAGRAKIILFEPKSHDRYVVDWDKAEKLTESWQKIIEKEMVSVPKVPERMILGCNIGAWEGFGIKGVGFAAAIAQNFELDEPDWYFLANKLNSKFEGDYCISSDGTLPTDVSGEMENQLDVLTDKAVEHIRQRIDVSILADNQSLRFLTWQFKRCPDEVVEYLLDACREIIEGGDHTFNIMGGKVLVFQGLGRTVTLVEHEKKALELLLSSDLNKWNWRVEAACISFILCRSESAHKFLIREDINKLSDYVVDQINGSIGGTYTKFKYFPLLIYGILRWRNKEPLDLITGADDHASRMAKVVSDSIKDVEKKLKYESGKKLGNFKSIIEILQELQSALEGGEIVSDLPRKILNLDGN